VEDLSKATLPADLSEILKQGECVEPNCQKPECKAKIYGMTAHQLSNSMRVIQSCSSMDVGCTSHNVFLFFSGAMENIVVQSLPNLELRVNLEATKFPEVELSILEKSSKPTATTQSGKSKELSDKEKVEVGEEEEVVVIETNVAGGKQGKRRGKAASNDSKAAESEKGKAVGKSGKAGCKKPSKASEVSTVEDPPIT